MATHTPNLGLKKPAGSDYVQVGDLNSNSDVLDNAIGNPTQLQTVNKMNIVAAINEARTTGGEHTPYIGPNGNWWEWDIATAQYVDSGTKAQGPKGDSGEDGVNAYVHIKWSAYMPIQDSDMKDTPDEFIGIYAGVSEAAPIAFTAYKWYKYKGDQGPQGVQGEQGRGLAILGYFDTLQELEAAIMAPSPGDAYGIGAAEPYEVHIWDGVNNEWVNNGQIQGADGRPAYVWIRYAAQEPTKDSDIKTEPDAWVGVFAGSESTPPTDFTVYQWYSWKGAPGLGVPAGGAAGNVLKKKSGADYDTEWGEPGGDVNTVNDQLPDETGNVIVAASDIAATPPADHEDWDTVQKYLAGLEGRGSGGTAIAPPDVTSFAAVPGNAVVTLTWQDPDDIMVGGTPIVWAGTKIVRKPGSYPANENDGTVVVNSTVRDQYKTAGFTDTGLTNGTTYYYQAFPYSTDGGINRNETNRASATPTNEYLENMLQFVAALGATGEIRLKIEMPLDADGAMIRYKTTPWVEGDDENTGTLAGNITDDSAYKGPNQWFKISGLTDGQEYHPKAFPHKSGVYNRAIGVNEAHFTAGGLIQESTFDSISGNTLNDTNGSATVYNGTMTNVALAPGVVGDCGVFNGNNSYISFGNPVIPVGPKTIFIKINFATAQTGLIFDNTGTSGTAQKGITCYLLDGNIRIWQGIGTSGTQAFSFMIPAGALNTWHKMCLRWDGLIGTNNVQLEYDGVKYATSAIANDVVPSANLSLGRLPNPASNYYSGKEDQLRICNRVLTDEEANIMTSEV